MRLNVQGMTCAHCERAIRHAVEAIGGTASVDLGRGTVEVEGLADEAAVRQAIEAEGYTVMPLDDAEAGSDGCCGAKR